MRKLVPLFASLLLLVATQAADAKKAAAEPVAHVLVKSGPNAAKDWVPSTRPNPGDPVLIPAGKTLNVNVALNAGSLTVEGDITNANPIYTTGDVTITGHIDWTGTLRTTGLNHFRPGPNVIGAVEQDEYGVIQLEEPLTTGYLGTYGSLSTGGNRVRVLGLAYPFQGSYSNFGASTIEAGEWLAYSLKEEPLGVDTLQESMSADLIVRGEARSTTKPGNGRCWRSVLMEAGETMLSSSSYQVEGAWTDNTPSLTVERDSTITVEGDSIPGEVVFGPKAQTVQSSVPGRSYALSLPYDLEGTTTATISDMHVTGATLTLHGATDGGGNEGIVFD